MDLPRVRVDLVGARAGDLDLVRVRPAARCRSRRTLTSATSALPLLAAIGLLVLPGATQSLAGRIRTVIDGMMIAGAVLLCSWVLVLDQVYAAGGDGIVPTLISLAYPLGDVVLITIGAVRAAARPCASRPGSSRSG